LEKILLLARGPGQNAPEASVGLPPVSEDESPFPAEEAEGIFPAPSMKKLAPYASKRTGLAPGPWAPLAFTPNPSSSDLGQPLLNE
jgi:hypothetical protein